MSNESGAAESIPEIVKANVSEEQVAAFLSANPDFFLDHQELLANLTLPHQSGEAVSLLERQVSVLRERSYHANAKLVTCWKMPARTTSYSRSPEFWCLLYCVPDQLSSLPLQYATH